MIKNNVFTLIAIIVCAVLLSHIKSCSEPVTKPDEAWQHRIDSLLQNVSGRDTLLIRRDTVIFVTNTIHRMSTDYRNTTDTITKLILCDSIVVACDSLAYQFNRQDSVWREQVSDLKQVVSIQDTVIQSQSGEIKKLKRRNRFLIGLSALLGVVAVVK